MLECIVFKKVRKITFRFSKINVSFYEPLTFRFEDYTTIAKKFN